jgi:hypothetical protein
VDQRGRPAAKGEICLGTGRTAQFRAKVALEVIRQAKRELSQKVWATNLTTRLERAFYAARRCLCRA